MNEFSLFVAGCTLNKVLGAQYLFIVIIKN